MGNHEIYQNINHPTFLFSQPPQSTSNIKSLLRLGLILVGEIEKGCEIDIFHGFSSCIYKVYMDMSYIIIDI